MGKDNTDKEKESKKKTDNLERSNKKNPKKPPGHTGSLGGSRQGNAGMEQDSEGAHR